MRIIRMPDIAVESVARVPPGAGTLKFYHEGELTVTSSGRDSHPSGARLIRIHAHVDTPSTSGSIDLLLKKNGVKFKSLSIPQDKNFAEVELLSVERNTFSGTTNNVSMDFTVADYMNVEISNIGSGAENLTVLAIFDR